MKYAKRTQKYVNFDTAAEAATEGVRKHGFTTIQPKYDGWWACIEVKGGAARIFSRQGQLKDTMEWPDKGSAVLIGEYLVGTQRSVKGGAEGHLMVFDAVEVAKSVITGEAYRDRMEAAMDFCAGVPFVSHPDEYATSDYARAWKNEVTVGGAEGLVFRSMRDPYDCTIGRVKQTFTMDYVVMAVEPGEGKHAGRMGRLVCGLFEGKKLVEVVRVGGGFKDHERDAAWKKPKDYIGRVIEVRGWQVFDSGALRHPNFVRFRDDKSARECVKKEVR